MQNQTEDPYKTFDKTVGELSEAEAKALRIPGQIVVVPSAGYGPPNVPWHKRHYHEFMLFAMLFGIVTPRVYCMEGVMDSYTKYFSMGCIFGYVLGAWRWPIMKKELRKIYRILACKA